MTESMALTCRKSEIRKTKKMRNIKISQMNWKVKCNQSKGPLRIRTRSILIKWNDFWLLEARKVEHKRMQSSRFESWKGPFRNRPGAMLIRCGRFKLAGCILTLMLFRIGMLAKAIVVMEAKGRMDMAKTSQRASCLAYKVTERSRRKAQELRQLNA